MNKVELMGRLTREPDIRRNDNDLCIARYTLAVDRRFKSEEQTADFISCVAFGKSAEFVEKYIGKGMRIVVVGRIQTGSYQHRDGYTVYTTDVIAEEHYFADNMRKEETNTQEPPAGSSPDGFMTIPDDIDEELPWN